MTGQDFAKLELPDNPGVYFFKGPKTKGADGLELAPVLYIGRATSLRDRVKSYFSNDLIKTRGQLLVDMVAAATSIEWQVTDSVLEAIILENNLIKSSWPLYNTKDKDNRSYNYVVITDEDFPQVMLVRGRQYEMENAEGDTVKGRVGTFKIKKKFGPYPQAGLLREALGIVRKIFPFRYARTGKTPAPHHEAFYRAIELSPDISTPEAKKEYAKTIRNLSLFFQGHKRELISALEKDMKAYAKSHKFEKAAKVKGTLYALGHIQDVALIKSGYNVVTSHHAHDKSFRIEAYDIAHLSGKEVVGVMVVVDAYKEAGAEGGSVMVGFEPNKNEYRKFKLSKNVNDDTGNLREVISRRIAHDEWRTPDLIVIDGGQGQINAAQEIIAAHPEYVDVRIVSVVKDNRHKARDIMVVGADLDAEAEVKKTADLYQKAILLANAEAHRFAIAYHRYRRRRATGL